MFSTSFRFIVFFGMLLTFQTVFTASIRPRGKTPLTNGSVNRKRQTNLSSSVTTRPITTSSSLYPLPFVEELGLPQYFTTTGENVDMYEGSANVLDGKEEFTSSVNPLSSTPSSLQKEHLKAPTRRNSSVMKPAIHPLEWLFFYSSTTERPTTYLTSDRESDQHQRMVTATTGLQENSITEARTESPTPGYTETATSPYSTHFGAGSPNEANKLHPSKPQNVFPGAKPEPDAKHNTILSVELQELADALQKVTSLLQKLSQHSDREITNKVSAQILGTLLAVNITTESSTQSPSKAPYAHSTPSTFSSTTQRTTSKLSHVERNPSHDRKDFHPSIQVPEDVFIFRNDTWFDPYYLPVNPYYFASATPFNYETFSKQTPPPAASQPQVNKNDVVNQGVSLSLTSITDKIGVLGNLFSNLREQTPEAKQQLFLTIMVGIPMITAFLAALGVSQLILAPIAMVIPFYLMMTFADSNLPKRQKRSSPTTQYVEIPVWDELVYIFNCLQDYERFSSGGWAKLET